MFNQLDQSELTKYEAALKDLYFNRALDNGIIEKGQDQAKYLITNLIKFNPDYKGADVVINIKDSEIEKIEVDEAFNDSLY